MTSIMDVAKKAGVSKTTVSRVLLDSNKVKPETKEKILKAMEELNYSPNNSARALASKRSMNIGVISSYTFNDPFYSIVEEEIYNTCAGQGYSVLFVVNKPSVSVLRGPVEILTGRVDGFVYLGEDSCHASEVKKLVKNAIPVAGFKTGMEISGMINADIDNEKASFEGTEYLIRLGHRKIAVISGKQNYYETRSRLIGYRKALEENGIPYDENMIFDGGFSYNNGLKLAKDVLKTHATAVFCFNDVMAHGFIRGAKNEGCSVPEDVSVLGYDDIIFSNYDSYINLSTVRQPLREMGRYLANTILDQINGHEVKMSRIFETTICEKETTRKV